MRSAERTLAKRWETSSTDRSENSRRMPSNSSRSALGSTAAVGSSRMMKAASRKKARPGQRRRLVEGGANPRAPPVLCPATRHAASQRCGTAWWHRRPPPRHRPARRRGIRRRSPEPPRQRESVPLGSPPNLPLPPWALTPARARRPQVAERRRGGLTYQSSTVLLRPDLRGEWGRPHGVAARTASAGPADRTQRGSYPVEREISPTEPSGDKFPPGFPPTLPTHSDTSRHDERRQSHRQTAGRSPVWGEVAGQGT